MIPEPPLLVITDRLNAAGGPFATIEAVFAAGGRWVMVREKDLATDDLTSLVADVVALARPFDATVIVNGDADAACRAGARGIHLPRGASIVSARAVVGPNGLIGVSAHSLAEIEGAASAGADYVTLSPVFTSVSKPGYGPLIGLDGLRKCAANTKVSVIALGGIGPENAAQCLEVGAAGVAVMGSVMRSHDPRGVVRDLVLRLSQTTS